MSDGEAHKKDRLYAAAATKLTITLDSKDMAATVLPRYGNISYGQAYSQVYLSKETVVVVVEAIAWCGEKATKAEYALNEFSHSFLYNKLREKVGMHSLSLLSWYSLCPLEAQRDVYFHQNFIKLVGFFAQRKPAHVYVIADSFSANHCSYLESQLRFMNIDYTTLTHVFTEKDIAEYRRLLTT